MKSGGRFASYSSKWEFDSCLLHNCKFPKLTEVDYGFRFENCTFLSMTFPEIEHPRKKDRPYDDMQVLRQEWNRIEACTFFGCTVPPTVFWCAVGSNFVLTRFVPGKAFESADPTEVLAYVAETEGLPPQKVLAENRALLAPLEVKNAEKPFPCFRFPGPLPLAEARDNARFRKWYGTTTKKK